MSKCFNNFNQKISMWEIKDSKELGNGSVKKEKMLWERESTFLKKYIFWLFAWFGLCTFLSKSVNQNLEKKLWT